jgi:O-antigen ligase
MGLFLIELGATVTLAATPVSLALMNAGFAAGCLGLILARPPVGRLPGLGLGCALAAWIAATSLVHALRSPHVGFQFHYHAAYGWLALYPALIAFRRAAVARRATLLLCGVLAGSLALAAVQFAVGFAQHRSPWRVDPAGLRFDRVSGFLGSPIALAVVGMFTVLALAARRGDARLRIAAAILAIPAIFFGGARSAMIGTAAGAVVQAWIQARRRLLALSVIAGGIVAALLAVAATKPERISNALQFRDGRVYIWRVSGSLLAEHPWLGMGRQEFQRLYPQRWRELGCDPDDPVAHEESVAHAHSSLLALSVENGVPAAVLHLAFLAALALAARRAPTREARAAVWGMIVAWLAAGVFNNLAATGENSFAFMSLLGLAWAAPRTDAEPPTGRIGA